MMNIQSFRGSNIEGHHEDTIRVADMQDVLVGGWIGINLQLKADFPRFAPVICGQDFSFLWDYICWF